MIFRFRRQVFISATGLLEFPHEEILNMMKETAERMEALREKYDVRCDSAHVSIREWRSRAKSTFGSKLNLMTVNEVLRVFCSSLSKLALR